MRVALFGNAFFCGLVERRLNTYGPPLGVEASVVSSASFRNMAKAIRDADIVVAIGHGVKALALARAMGRPGVKYWTGDDVWEAVHPRTAGQWLRRLMAKSAAKGHLAVAPWLSQELLQAGIQAIYIPTVSVDIDTATVPPLPERFTVLAYWTDPYFLPYQGDLVHELARELPDVRFLVIGTDGAQGEAPANMEFRGWVPNVSDIWAEVSVLLRIPKHDGLASIVLEALAHGRQVIRNYSFPHCHFASSKTEIKERILFLQKNPRLNLEGRAFVMQEFDPRESTLRLISFLSSLAKR